MCQTFHAAAARRERTSTRQAPQQLCCQYKKQECSCAVHAMNIAIPCLMLQTFGEAVKAELFIPFIAPQASHSVQVTYDVAYSALMGALWAACRCGRQSPSGSVRR